MLYSSNGMVVKGIVDREKNGYRVCLSSLFSSHVFANTQQLSTSD